MLIIRDADITDSLDIFFWRNDPISCQMFINNNKVTLEEHEKWFENSLINPLRKIYIGILRDVKVGICRFDVNTSKTSAEVSINMNPSMRGKNLSCSLLLDAIRTYKELIPIKLTATIRKENEASLKIFQQCCFSIVDKDISFYYLSEN